MAILRAAAAACVAGLAAAAFRAPPPAKRLGAGAGPLGNDPADSWLAYAKAAGKGSRVLSVNMTWTVPAYPKTRSGGNAPGWWFGIEPNPADVLIQPILAYGDGTPDYTIFTGFFDWHDGNWVQSTVAPVKPGDVIYGNVTWDAKTSTYTQQVGKRGGGAPIVTKVSKADEHAEVFTDVYVVVEHQPNSCSEYPANGNVTFTDIQISWASGAPLTLASWTVAPFKPACSSVAKALSANSVQLSWKTA